MSFVAGTDQHGTRNADTHLRRTLWFALYRILIRSDIKNKVSNATHAFAVTAKNVGHKIAESATEAKDRVAEKAGLGTKEGSSASVAGIKERLDVIASCGKRMGIVDHVVGNAIQLTKNGINDGQHHFIPTM